MDWLEKVSKHHEEYLRFLQAMGCTSHAEDIVQEMYLRLHHYNAGEKVINEKGEVSKSYIWRVLNNMYKSYLKDKGKFFFYDITEFKAIESEDYKEQREGGYTKITQKLYKELNNLDKDGYPYNKELFTLYIESGMSMRALSTVTRISVTNIFNTVNFCKNQLRERLGEDYEDFNNEDYDKL